MICSKFSMLQVLTILFIACFFQDGQAVDVSFSAESGGDSLAVSDEYIVDTGISVSEDNTAEFGDLNIQSSRQISGTGDVKAIQVCTSGSGYSSQASYEASGASTGLSGSASLRPQFLIASQNIDASGGKADSSLGVTQGGATASISGGMTDGTMSSSQSIWTGSAHASQSMSAAGDEVRFSGLAKSSDRQGYLGATTHNYQGTIGASAVGDYADVAEVGELSGGYTVEGMIGGVRRSVTTVTGTWLRDMRATDADSVGDTNDRTGGLEGFNHILQTIIDETPDGGTAIFPVGSLSENVNLWKNVQVIVELGGRMLANSINLDNNAQLLSGSMGFFSPVVTVNEGSKINDGLQLASDSGTVTVTPGIYNDVVNQDYFYPKGIQLNGEAGSVTNQIILDQYVSGKISGLHADTVQVNQGASINEGLVLAKDTGLVSVTAGTYADNVNQGFYSHAIQLNGDDGAITNQITLDRDVNSEISGLRGSTVQVYSGASIQEGIDLAKVIGTVNVDDGVADGQSAVYNKDVFMNANNNILDHLTIDRDAFRINGFNANTVQVNSGALIQDGVNLATASGTVNVDNSVADGQNVNYNKYVYLNANDNLLHQLTIDRDTIRISDLTANIVQVNSGASINQGLGLSEIDGTVNVGAGIYADTVTQGFYSKNLQLNGASGAITNQITLDRNVNGKISGLLAGDVEVGSNAKIQQALTLAKDNGIINLATGHDYAEDVDYNKGVTLNGHDATTSKLTLSTDAAAISSLLADTVDVSSAAKIQQGLYLTKAAGTLNLASGNNYAENVNYNKGVTLNGNNAITSKLILSTDAAGIGSLLADTVDVSSAAKIQQGLYLTKAAGTLNLASGNNYAEDVNYNKGVTLNGNNAITSKLTLSTDAAGIGSLLADTVDVSAAAKIQQGLYLTKAAGTLNLASGNNYAEDVNYNKGVTLNGHDATTSKLTLSTDAAGIGSLLADTVDVSSAAKIQQGLYLTKDAGTLNLASGNNYAEDVNYNKGVTLNGHGATTSEITINRDASLVSGLTASTVDVGASGKIQQGINLAKDAGTVNLAASHAYSENVDYNKGVTLNGNSATASEITINRDASLVSGLTADTVDVGVSGKIQQGINLAKDAGTVNLAASHAYGENVNYNKAVTLDGNGATTTGQLTLGLDPSLIQEFAAGTVDAGTAGTIRQGMDLATSGGTVKLSAKDYGENINYDRTLTIQGNGATTDQITINRDASLVSGLTASTVDVGASGKIQQGISLAKDAGTVNLAASHAYGENVNYNKAVTLDGNGATTTGQLTLGLDPSLIREFAAGTVDAGTAGTIRQGMDLATSGGTVKLSAKDYGENVNYDKTVTIQGNGATTDQIIINRDASLVGGLTADTVDVGASGKIQQGINLAKDAGTVNLAASNAYGENVNYNKAITLNGNSATANSLTLNANPSNIHSITAMTVDTGSSGTIQKGLELSKVGVGTLVLSNKDYMENVNYNKVVNIVANGATTDKVTLSVDASGLSGLTADTYQVDQGGLISQGINLATEGSTLYIGSGTFYERLTLGKSLTLDGTGSTIINGQNAGTVIKVNSGAYVTLKDLQVTGGYNTGENAGGITNDGVLTLENTLISGNNAGRGGGIVNHGTLTMNSGTNIAGNSASEGAGIYSGSGTVTMNTGSTISGNGNLVNTNYGGGIFISNTNFIMNGGSITGNSANNGGGLVVYEVGANAYLYGGSISGNTNSGAYPSSNDISILSGGHVW